MTIDEAKKLVADNTSGDLNSDTYVTQLKALLNNNPELNSFMHEVGATGRDEIGGGGFNSRWKWAVGHSTHSNGTLGDISSSISDTYQSVVGGDAVNKFQTEFENIVNNPTDPIDWTDKGTAELIATIATGGTHYVAALAEAASAAGASDEDIVNALNTISLGSANATGILPVGAAIGGAVADQTGGDFGEGMAIGTAAQVAIGTAIAAGGGPLAGAATTEAGSTATATGTAAASTTATTAAAAGTGSALSGLGGVGAMDVISGAAAYQALTSEGIDAPQISDAVDAESLGAQRDAITETQANQSAGYDASIENVNNFDGTVTYNPVTAASTASAGTASGAGASAGVATAASVDFEGAGVYSSLDGAMNNTEAFFQVQDEYMQDFTKLYGNPSTNIATYFEDYKPEQLEAIGMSQIKAEFQAAADKTKQQLAMNGLSGSGIEKGVLNDVSISQAEALSSQRVANFDTYYDKLMNYNMFEATSKISIMAQQMQTLGMQNDLSKTYAQMQASEEQINADYQQQASLTNANNQTSASIASASNATQASIANANNQTRVNMQNQTEANSMAKFNATMGYQSQVDNRNFDFTQMQYGNQLEQNKWASLLGNQTQMYGIDQGVATSQANMDYNYANLNAQNEAGWWKLAGNMVGSIDFGGDK